MGKELVCTVQPFSMKYIWGQYPVHEQQDNHTIITRNLPVKLRFKAGGPETGVSRWQYAQQKWTIVIHLPKSGMAQ